VKPGVGEPGSVVVAVGIAIVVVVDADFFAVVDVDDVVVVEGEVATLRKLKIGAGLPEFAGAFSSRSCGRCTYKLCGA
jgi:hypothetical protein